MNPTIEVFFPREANRGLESTKQRSPVFRFNPLEDTRWSQFLEKTSQFVSLSFMRLARGASKHLRIRRDRIHNESTKCRTAKCSIVLFGKQLVDRSEDGFGSLR